MTKQTKKAKFDQTRLKSFPGDAIYAMVLRAKHVSSVNQAKREGRSRPSFTMDDAIKACHNSFQARIVANLGIVDYNPAGRCHGLGTILESLVYDMFVAFDWKWTAHQVMNWVRYTRQRGYDGKMLEVYPTVPTLWLKDQVEHYREIAKKHQLSKKKG